MKTFLLSHLLVAATVVLTLAFAAAILRSRRAPGSIIAWLTVIIFAPYVGIPLYLLLSTRKIKMRSKDISRSKFDSHDQELIEWSDPESLFYDLGASKPVTAAKVQLLMSGADSYWRVLNSIRSARKSIFLTTFIFGNDDVGRAIVSALAEKSRSGVEVRLLVDSLGALLLGHPSFRDLSKSGAKMAYFMPVLHIPFRGRTNLRNHRKLFIIDGGSAVLGGMNIAKEYFGPVDTNERWVDLGLYVEGDCVVELQKIFASDWSYATGEQLTIEDCEATPKSIPAAFMSHVQVVRTGPDTSADALYDILLSSIFKAKRQITVVTPYFIPDEALTKALELAAKRGVRVRVLLPLKSNHYMADLARGSYIAQLESAGAEFRYFNRMIHAKAIVLDDEVAIVGSTNFDMRSLLLNYELGFILYASPTLNELGNWIETLMESSILEKHKAGATRETAEGIGRLLGPLL